MKATKIQTTAMIAVCATLLSGVANLPAGEGPPEKGSGDLRKITPREEFFLLLKRAEDGDADAQFAVACAYDHPSYDRSWDGVPQNQTESVRWLRKAADQGHAGAQNSLGLRYSIGQGVLKDRVEAVNYYRRAAEQGDGPGQFNLGMCYRSGEGVAQDKIQACKWLNVALAHESPGTRRDTLESHIAELSATMTPQQVSLAQRFATEFVPLKRQPTRTNEGERSASESPTATGSGFFISDDGILVTNFHVVERASRLVAKTKRGSFAAKVVKLDPVNDIAVLRVAGPGVHSLPLRASRSVKLGESVFTVGFPNPQLQGTEPKFTDGKISSLAGVQDDARQFQISVAVQPGNSGGALVDSAGNVVGIVTARLSDKAALETSGLLPQNVNYALKSSYVLSFLESVPDLVGKLKEPWPPKERKFEDVVKETQEATAQVLAY